MKEKGDVPKEGLSDHEEDKSSKQEAKALNQEAKDVIFLFSSPWSVVKPVATTDLLPMLDPGKVQLYWLIT